MVTLFDNQIKALRVWDDKPMPVAHEHTPLCALLLCDWSQMERNMDGIDQLIALNDEYIRGIVPPQDYKHNLAALIRSFTEDELKRLSQLISSGEASGYESSH